MVLGSIVNWVVFRTLDLSAYAIWWLTKTSVYGAYSIGHYMIVPKNKTFENMELVHLSEKELILFKEHNELLKKQNSLLQETFNLGQNNKISTIDDFVIIESINP
jgi:hypothetical protein